MFKFPGDCHKKILRFLKHRRVTRGGRGVGLPCPFSKIGKNCPNFGGNVVIAVIYWLNFSFKVQFLRVSRRKNRRFFHAGPFFFVLQMIVYRSALILRKLPCPKKLLVTRLKQRAILKIPSTVF